MDQLVFTNFETAAHAVLAFLHRRLGFDLWMVTRTEGDDWIVLQAEDHGYQVKSGTVFRWADSFCSRMVQGLGPRIAPRSDDVPAYASAPIAQQVTIGAYVGMPLRRADGELFGTLCAIHPAARPQEIVEEQELVEMLSALLSTLLEAELQSLDQTRRTEHALAEALIDPLTGLYNRRGWSRLLAGEESRCRRYGSPATVIAIDLDKLKIVNDALGHFAGDELIARAAAVIQAVARSHDVAARVGGDEFALLAVACDPHGTGIVVSRLREAFADAGIEASIGSARRDPAQGLQQAWEDADSAMYDNKRSRYARAGPEHLSAV
jgi:diguanylate cyclase